MQFQQRDGVSISISRDSHLRWWGHTHSISSKTNLVLSHLPAMKISSMVSCENVTGKGLWISSTWSGELWPTCSSSPATFHYPRLLKALCKSALNASRDGASTISLDIFHPSQLGAIPLLKLRRDFTKTPRSYSPKWQEVSPVPVRILGQRPLLKQKFCSKRAFPTALTQISFLSIMEMRRPQVSFLLFF